MEASAAAASAAERLDPPRAVVIRTGGCDRRRVTDSAGVRAALLGTMVGLQAGWLLTRSRLIGAPLLDPVTLGPLGFSLAAAAAIALLPARAVAAADLALGSLARRDRLALAIVAGLALVVGLAGAAVQQPASWDERFLLPAARLVADHGLGRLFAEYAEMTWLGPNHPPLAVVLYGLVLRHFGPDPYALRVVAALFGAATVVASVLLVRRLLGRQIALLAGLVLLSSPLFVRMSSAAMNDILVTFSFVVSLNLALRLARRPGPATDVLLGLAIGTGLLTKYTMVFVFPVIVAVLWCEGALLERRRELALAIALSLAMVAAWLGGALVLGILGEQQAFVSYALGVGPGSRRRLWYPLDGLLTKLPSGLGIYDLPLLALGAMAALERRGRALWLIGLWIALLIVPLVATLPDNRYFLPTYPAFAALIALGLGRLGTLRVRALALSWLLCAATLAYYAQIDLTRRAFLFRTLLGS